MVDTFSWEVAEDGLVERLCGNTGEYMVFACGYVNPLLSGGYSGGVPPLPIPNREVKPACADGTAMQCGRVGSRLLYESLTDQR